MAIRLTDYQDEELREIQKAFAVLSEHKVFPLFAQEEANELLPRITDLSDAETIKAVRLADGTRSTFLALARFADDCNREVRKQQS